MKKKKAHRRKSVSKKSNVMPTAGISKQRKAGRAAIPEKEVPRLTPLKKDVYKKVDNSVFAPKRYFIVARQFLAEAKVELKKVTWPTRKELLSTTGVVIIFVFLFVFFFFIVYFGLVKIINNLI